MSASGPKQTLPCALHESAFGGKADMAVLHCICPLLAQSGHGLSFVQLLPSGLIVDTCFDLPSKFSNIEQALSVRIGAAFNAQLLTKRCIFGGNFFCANSRILRLNFVHLWKGKCEEIDHKCNERCPQREFYVFINVTNYFPNSGCFHRP